MTLCTMQGGLQSNKENQANQAVELVDQMMNDQLFESLHS